MGGRNVETLFRRKKALMFFCFCGGFGGRGCQGFKNGDLFHGLWEHRDLWPSGGDVSKILDEIIASIFSMQSVVNAIKCTHDTLA